MIYSISYFCWRRR